MLTNLGCLSQTVVHTSPVESSQESGDEVGYSVCKQALGNRSGMSRRPYVVHYWYHAVRKWYILERIVHVRMQKTTRIPILADHNDVIMLGYYSDPLFRVAKISSIGRVDATQWARQLTEMDRVVGSTDSLGRMS